MLTDKQSFNKPRPLSWVIEHTGYSKQSIYRLMGDCNGFCGNSKSDNLGENQNGISSYEPR